MREREKAGVKTSASMDGIKRKMYLFIKLLYSILDHKHCNKRRLVLISNDHQV